MVLEYITNIYILPLISTIIGLILVYLYDKFEKKQYTNAIYLRIGLTIYISTYGALYISKIDYFSDSSKNKIQSGGDLFDPQLAMPKPNEIKTHFEQFKIGVPTF